MMLSALLSDWQALPLTSKRPSYAAEAVRALRNAFARHLELALPISIEQRPSKRSTPWREREARPWRRGQRPMGKPPMTLEARRFLCQSARQICPWHPLQGESAWSPMTNLLRSGGRRTPGHSAASFDFSEEVAGMTWVELSDDTWAIPASRAKNGATPESLEHRPGIPRLTIKAVYVKWCSQC